MGRMRVRRRRDERGASAVEFALLVLPLTLLVFGIVAFGIMLSFRQTLSQAATEGARAAAVQIDESKRKGDAEAAVAEAMGAVIFGDGSMSCGSDGLICTAGPYTPGPGETACAAGAECYEVTVSYPYQEEGPVQIPLVNGLMPETLEYSAVVRVS
jgi:Flp pilus assembly protein TadG